MKLVNITKNFTLNWRKLIFTFSLLNFSTFSLCFRGQALMLKIHKIVVQFINSAINYYICIHIKTNWCELNIKFALHTFSYLTNEVCYYSSFFLLNLTVLISFRYWKHEIANQIIGYNLYSNDFLYNTQWQKTKLKYMIQKELKYIFPEFNFELSQDFCKCKG